MSIDDLPCVDDIPLNAATADTHDLYKVSHSIIHILKEHLQSPQHILSFGTFILCNDYGNIISIQQQDDPLDNLADDGGLPKDAACSDRPDNTSSDDCSIMEDLIFACTYNSWTGATEMNCPLN